MATITKSIGTSSRDYSTITLWEADLDDTGIYTSGDDAVGECYDDSTFDEIITINGGSTVGLSSTKLSVASGQRHDGTSGSGARIVKASQGSGNRVLTIDISVARIIEWLEIDSNSYRGEVYWDLSGSSASAIARNMIVHDNFHDSLNGSTARGLNGTPGTFLNNIVYNITTERSSSFGVVGTGGSGSASQVLVYNCTVHNIVNNNGAGTATAIYSRDLSNHEVKNCIATNVTGTSTGSLVGFNSTSSTVKSNNLSSDSTASGTGSLTGKTAANQFVSTVSGSEDLHLLSTADAVGAGEDLATTSIDINGSDRNALAATVWDIGAHQYASTASIGTSSRDYSTIALWEADLDDTTIYGAGANAVGEIYNDSAFSISAGTTILRSLDLQSSMTLTVPKSERHDGTAGTGAKLTNTGTNYASWFIACREKNIRIEYLEFEFDDWAGYDGGGIYFYISSTGDSDVNGCLFHSLENGSVSPAQGVWISSNTTGMKVHNNVFVTMGYCIRTSYGGYSYIYNNTGYGSSIANRSYVGIDYINFSTNVDIRSNIMANFQTADIDTGWTISPTTNATSDSSGQITGITPSDHFVSVVSGSEDLHLLASSSLRGAGQDLGSDYAIDIDGTNRDAFTGTSWDIGADQVYITASIGTSSRDYSTIGLWEADLDDTSLYTSGDDAVGECYNDSTFTLGASIDGGTTVGLSSVTLSVAEGERHDGTLSAGVFINPTYSIGSSGLVKTARSNTTIEWLTCEVNGASTYSHTAIILHDIYSSNTLSRNMVLKGEDKVYPAQTPVGIRSGGHENIAHNNIIYGIANGSTGAGIQDSYRRCNALSNTIYGCNYGYQATAQGGDARNVKNNLSIGNNSDFYAAGTGGYVSSNNASSDSTATALGGSNHVTGAPVSRQFVSTLSGSEDLHLIFKSAAIDAGVDLGTTPDGVQYDINGKDRDTENSIWDIGAHEYGDNVVFGLLRV